MCGRAVTWRMASAGRLTSKLCAHAHLERSNAKLTLKVKMLFFVTVEPQTTMLTQNRLTLKHSICVRLWVFSL